MFCWSHDDGKYLLNGDCFENELLRQFKECLEYNAYNGDDWVITLNNHLKQEKGSMHEQDILNAIFIEKISLDFDFAEKLNLYDVLSIDCFTETSKLGSAIRELCSVANSTFIVSKKHYTSKEVIRIDFEVCHFDNVNECHKALIKQQL